MRAVIKLVVSAAVSIAPVSSSVAFAQASGRAVGALKVLVFQQRQFGLEASSDATSKGVTVGFVVGRRWAPAARVWRAALPPCAAASAAPLSRLRPEGDTPPGASP